MTVQSLIAELRQNFPPEAEVHVLIADYAPKAWRPIVTVMEEIDPDKKPHAVISVFAGLNISYDPVGKLR